MSFRSELSSSAFCSLAQQIFPYTSGSPIDWKIDTLVLWAWPPTSHSKVQSSTISCVNKVNRGKDYGCTELTIESIIHLSLLIDNNGTTSFYFCVYPEHIKYISLPLAPHPPKYNEDLILRIQKIFFKNYYTHRDCKKNCPTTFMDRKPLVVYVQSTLVFCSSE